MLLLLQLSKSKVFHSSRTGVVRVSIMSHLCCSCRISVARVARVWHWCCKLDQIFIQQVRKIFRKSNILAGDTLTYMCVSGGKKYQFFEKCCVLSSFEQTGLPAYQLFRFLPPWVFLLVVAIPSSGFHYKECTLQLYSALPVYIHDVMNDHVIMIIFMTSSIHSIYKEVCSM